jgi:hypothetical protein
MPAPGSRLAYAGLPALLVISVALPAIRWSPSPFLMVASRRANRFLVPWVFWSVVFGVVLAVHALSRRERLSDVFHASMLVGGTAFHLWYLPFAFVASLAVALVMAHLEPLPPWLTCMIGACCGGMMLIMAAPAAAAPTPYREWCFGAAAIPFGLAIGVAVRRASGLARATWLLVIAVVPILCHMGLVRLYGSDPTLPYYIGVPAVCAALAWQIPDSNLLQALTSLSLGIYVLHPLVLSLCVRPMSARLHIASAIAAAIAVVLSAGLTWGLKRLPMMPRFL